MKRKQINVVFHTRIGCIRTWNECRALAMEEVVWESLCRRRFEIPVREPPPSWRELYIWNHMTLQMFLRQDHRNGHEELMGLGARLTHGRAAPILIGAART